MESQILAKGLQDMKRTRILSNGKLVYFLRTAFPSVNRLKEKYTILKKAPWLLPVVWLVRPFCKLLAERGSLEKTEKQWSSLRRKTSRITAR